MIQPVQSSSVAVVGTAGQPVRGQATEKPVQSVKKMDSEQQNPANWQGSGGSADQIKDVVKQANAAMSEIRSGLEFEVDEETGRFVIKVVDAETKEVVRQLPTKEMLEIAKALKSISSGLFLNEKL